MNPTIFSYILLAMFGISVAVIYLYVRRGQINTLQGMVYGGVADVIIITLFFLSSQIPFWNAVLGGVVLGIIFNTMVAAAASFFRRNERTASAIDQ